MLTEYVKVSFLMMRSKPVRAALSLLGIYIGVMALLIILAIREGIRNQIEDAYRTVGAHVLLVHPGYDPLSKKIGRITRDDLDHLRQVRGIDAVYLRGASDWETQSSHHSFQAHVIGIDAQFIPLYRVPVIRGRIFFPDEVEKRRAVCLLSVSAARRLFPDSDPLGAMIDINGVPNKIIGVVAWDATMSQRTFIPQADVLLPLTWWGMDDAAQMMMTVEIRVSSRISSQDAQRLVVNALSHGDPSRASLYFVQSLEEMLKQSRDFSDRMLAGLLGIAAISLLVGGIGVANVMVTTVTERTREVGIRKALGARRIDILSQFLVESSILCGSGGLLAVGTGSVILFLVHAVTDVSVPMILTPVSMALCILLTLFIGLIAGAYPASRAAALSPAEALRYE